MTAPSVCDGSCLANHKPGDEIQCEDGEVLVTKRGTSQLSPLP